MFFSVRGYFNQERCHSLAFDASRIGLKDRLLGMSLERMDTAAGYLRRSSGRCKRDSALRISHTQTFSRVWLKELNRLQHALFLSP